MPRIFKCPECGSKNFNYSKYSIDEIIGNSLIYSEEWDCDDCKFEFGIPSPCTYDADYCTTAIFYIGKWNIYDEINELNGVSCEGDEDENFVPDLD